MDYAKLVAVILLALLMLSLYIYNFMQKSKEEKIETVIYWLRRTVYEAEESLGSGTGELKLATVYNKTISQFPWLAELYPYEKFDEELVKPALVWLNKQMSSNQNVKNLLGIK